MFYKLKLLLTLASMLLVYSAEASDWRDFTLESDQSFVVQTIGEGRIRKSEGIVEIRLSSLYLRPHPDVKEPVTISGIRIGLAKPSDTYVWEDYLYSEIQQFAAVIDNGDSNRIGPFQTFLELPEKQEYAASWVVLEIIIPTIEYGDTTVYAHEPGSPGL